MKQPVARQPVRVAKQPIPRDDVDAAPITLPQKKRGRPTRLTDEIASKILMAIKGGAYRCTAAAWAGIETDIFARWMMRDDEPYASFRRLVTEAEAHAELKMVSAVTKAADDDAKYAIAFLERKFPERWARAVAPGANVVLDLGSMLERIHTRMRQYRDPREARRMLSAGDVVLDVEGRALPRDPRPPRESVSESEPEPEETFDGEHDVDALA
ncbi:MAG: hypothetical protein ACRD1S_07785 [Vicinamibacterales bacterium]